MHETYGYTLLLLKIFFAAGFYFLGLEQVSIPHSILLYTSLINESFISVQFNSIRFGLQGTLFIRIASERASRRILSHGWKHLFNQ